MPVKSSVLNDGSLIVERWEGTVDRAALLSRAVERCQDGRIRHGAVLFADYRAARLGEITLAALEELGGVRRRKHVRTAVLVHEADWSRARAAEAQVEHEGLEVCCFNLLGVSSREMIEAACQWLGVDPDLVEAELQRLAAG
jgi:hypothetical protein